MKIIENQHLKTSNLIYDVNHSIYKYRDIKKINNLPLESKYFLANLFNDLDKVSKLKPQKEEVKEKKTNVFNTTLELHNDLLKTILMNTLPHLMPKEVK